MPSAPEPTECRAVEPEATWPRWGRTVVVPSAWHLWPFDGAGEALCDEATDADVVWAGPGDRNPEDTCLDCIALEPQPQLPGGRDPFKPTDGDVARELVAQGETIAAVAQRAVASAAKALAEPKKKRTRTKREPKTTLEGCGSLCREKNGTVIHAATNRTCSRYQGTDAELTPKPETKRRAGELATRFGGKATP